MVENAPLILAIESGIGSGSIALVRGNTLIEDRREGISRAEDILAAIDEMASRSGVALKQIGSIAVSLGPGSFTGIRIGISTALGLGRSLNVKYTGIPVLYALAASISAGTVVGAVAVGRQRFAIQKFRVNENIAVCANELSSLSHEELIQTIRNDPEIKYALGGQLDDEIPCRIAEEQLRNVQIVEQSLAAVIGFQAALPHSAFPFEPIYLQK